MSTHSLLDHENFRKIYEQLRGVSLNPERHETQNAYEHCEQVRERVRELAARNKISLWETRFLENVALAHDIGKISGSSSPRASLKILRDLKLGDKQFLDMIKYHDINLPWYQAYLRGEAPSESDWRKLSRKVELKLLLIFMIADRVDCPGGWKNNQPLRWFLNEARCFNLYTLPILTQGNGS
ncbi:MAG: HD domain-containing protein [bacterium]|nr:MAG: HD domain-containing protein [bacterium]